MIALQLNDFSGLHYPFFLMSMTCTLKMCPVKLLLLVLMREWKNCPIFPILECEILTLNSTDDYLVYIHFHARINGRSDLGYLNFAKRYLFIHASIYVCWWPLRNGHKVCHTRFLSTLQKLKLPEMNYDVSYMYVYMYMCVSGIFLILRLM